jgi:hypothetical protein
MYCDVYSYIVQSFLLSLVVVFSSEKFVLPDSFCCSYCLPIFALLFATVQVSESRIVPDKRSRILEVGVVRRIINLGTGNLEWGGNGKGLRKGRSVYE